MSNGFKTITVIGLGYIGLPTAAILARSGVNVVGVDVNKTVVESLQDGLVHIVEPELDELVRQVVDAGRLKAVFTPEESDAFIIAVPTPFMNDKTADITYIEQAARSIAPFLQAGNLVILESTSPVGTTEKLIQVLNNERPDLKFPVTGGENHDIHVAYCPERVLPGKIIDELVFNDRIIGGMTPACTEKAVQLYKLFVKGDCLVTDSRTAEMAKLTENAYRDVNIAFANELSIICDEMDINVWDLIRLSNHHPRVNILKPGPGVGGHCIAVDPWFIVEKAPQSSKLIRTAREINDSKPALVVKKIEMAMEQFKIPVIALLGLSYKANIDDLRESPALDILKEVAELNLGKIYVVEPHINTLPEYLNVKENIELASYDMSIKQSNVIVLLVDHDVFSIKPEAELLKGKVVIDTRGSWNI